MARFVTLGDCLLDLDAIRLVTFHRSEGWLEIDSGAPRPFVVEGRRRAETVWQQLQEVLAPAQWNWPEDEMLQSGERRGKA